MPIRPSFSLSPLRPHPSRLFAYSLSQLSSPLSLQPLPTHTQPTKQKLTTVLGVASFLVPAVAAALVAAAIAGAKKLLSR